MSATLPTSPSAPRPMLEHRLAASTPPTLQEAWAAVLDNPKLALRILQREGCQSEDDLQEARLAIVSAFCRWDPAKSKDILKLSRWAFRSKHVDHRRAVIVPKTYITAIRQWDVHVQGLAVRGQPVPAAPPPWMKLPGDAVGLAIVRNVGPAEATSTSDVDGGQAWLESLQSAGGREPDLALREAFDAAWSRLETRHRAVLVARFQDEIGLAAIGARIGVSRERARQIEHEALRKLREWMGQHGARRGAERAMRVARKT